MKWEPSVATQPQRISLQTQKASTKHSRNDTVLNTFYGIILTIYLSVEKILFRVLFIFISNIDILCAMDAVC